MRCPALGKVVRILGLLGLLAGARALAGDIVPPDFDFRIKCPRHVTGEPGDLVQFPATAILTTRPTVASTLGVQGWTLSLAATGGLSIVDATTAGTAGDKLPRGFVTDGFEITELTVGPGNEGAVSAVALYFTKQSMLPPQGESLLLKLTVETRIPAPGEACSEGTIGFRSGLKGSGLPITNSVTFDGQTRRDDGTEKDADGDKEEPAVVRSCIDSPFKRGDCKSDGQLDITDAIFILNFLFLGGSEPPCLGACDANDDDLLNITDPIYTLGYLFLGTAAPPPPLDACGEDPTPGPLGCAEPKC